MPKPNSIRKNIVENHSAQTPVAQGKYPTTAQIARDEEIATLGREIVDLVSAGRLRLVASKVIDDTLFVYTDSGYYVLAPGQKLQLSDTADSNAKQRPFQGLSSNLDNLRDNLISWKKLATPE